MSIETTGYPTLNVLTDLHGKRSGSEIYQANICTPLMLSVIFVVEIA